MFQNLGLTSVGIGVAFSIIFHVLLVEKTVVDESLAIEVDKPVKEKIG